MSKSFFRGRGTRAILAGGLLSLLFAVLLLVEGGARQSVETGAHDSYSSSAVGHHAFAELLRDLDFAVNQSRRGGAARGAVDAAWIVAEPPRDELRGRGEPALAELLNDRPEVLLVLPKRVVARVEEGTDTDELWVAQEGAAEPGWLAAEVLDAALDESPQVLAGVTSGPARFDAVDGSEFNVDVTDLQLIEDRHVRPLVWNDDGVLVGQLEAYTRSTVIVLSDPDLIATHGIGRADNAAVAVWALRQLPASSRLVGIDEVVHGHAFDPSLWNELTSFPLALVLVQALVAAGFLVWAGASRFGAALPPQEILAAGRSTLIANTAELLLRGGHSTYSLGRYFHRTVETVSDALHIPADAAHGRKVERLSETSERRGRSDDPQVLAREIDRLPTVRRVGARRNQARHVLRIAHRIHRWREEMVHGPTADPGDR